MKVVLLVDVPKVGKAGEIVEVKDGYGRNFLIKNKKGLPGTKENIEAALQRQADEAERLAQEKAAAVELAKRIDTTTITIKERASEEGTLFGSVTAKDIAIALKEQTGIEVDKRKIALEEPLRNVGKAEVRVKTYAGVQGNLTVKVERQ